LEFQHDELTRLWAAILGKLAHKEPRESLNELRSVQIASSKRKTLTLHAPNNKVKDVLENRLDDVVANSAREVLGYSVKIKVAIKQKEGAAKSAINLRGMRKPLIKKMVFDTFVAGPSNRLALSAALKVCEDPDNNFNPLAVYGVGGCGKTHLLNAIANDMDARGLKVMSIHAEKFTSNYVAAVKAGATRALRETFDDLNCLIIDGFEFLQGKRGTCNFFANIVNDFILYGRQLVIASAKSVSMLDIPTMLKSRISSGLEVKITAPSKKTRLTIFARIAEARQCPLPDDILSLLAEQSRLSIPQSAGILQEIIARSLLIGEQPSAQSARAAIATRVNEMPAKPSPKKVLEAVAAERGLAAKELCGGSRQRNVARSRQLAIYMVKSECDASFSEIGDLLGKRRGAVIQTAYKKFAEKLKSDADTAQLVTTVRERLYA